MINVEDYNCWAADQVYLPPYEMSELECKLLITIALPEDRRIYCVCRNAILALWIKSPQNLVSVTEAIQSIPVIGSVTHNSFTLMALLFLHRYRYINYGIFVKHKIVGLQSNQTSPPTVVIIGSGISGISAARELKNIYSIYPDDPSPNIIVLEAKRRLGGRCCTYPIQTRLFNSNYIPGVDIGAQIITGLEKNPLGTIIRDQLKYQLHFLKNAASSPIFNVDGSLVDSFQDLEVEEMFNQALDAACHSVISNGQVFLFDPSTKIGDLNPSTYDPIQPSLGSIIIYHLKTNPKFNGLNFTQRKLIHWHLANLEFANSGSINELSLNHWNQDDEYGFDGEHCMIQGGYGQVPLDLANGSDIVNVKFLKVVTDIYVSRTDGIISVNCADGSNFRDAVVVTTPLGVLKENKIKFTPPLPQSKIDSIKRLGFGCFNKVVLVFPKMFWNKNADSFGSLGLACDNSSQKSKESFDTMSRGEYFLFWNMYPTTQVPILVVFISGAAALKIQEETDATIVNNAMSVLKRIFSDQPIPNPIEAIVTRWSQDEFIRGSYSFIAAGSSGVDYDIMAQPTHNNKIFWAGEATNRKYPATVHGAYMSGQRVATEIANILLGTSLVSDISRSTYQPHKWEKNQGCTFAECPDLIVGNILDHLMLKHQTIESPNIDLDMLVYNRLSLPNTEPYAVNKDSAY